MTFAFCCGLAEARKDPSFDTCASLVELLKRMPWVAVWTWSNLFMEVIANQRLPVSVLEDSINKPWRPIPANRISQEESRCLLLRAIPVTVLLSWYLGVARECVAGIMFIWMYNDLGGSGEGWFTRNVLNAIALCTWYAAATAIILKRNGTPELSEQTRAWLVMVAIIITTTVQTQDFGDRDGDKVCQRRTMPLVFGDTATRWITAPLIMGWSLVCPRMWDVDVQGYYLPVAVGSLLAGHIICCKSVTAGRLSWKVWCCWMITIFVLPTYKVLSN